ncbi:SEDS family protein MrdB [Rhodovastum atsumiense]|uniref:Peptidoglycan glycosyltransferase MrdB n=1 Tax=Rhodovastum atsumiense TaxID=504468 RepID=A0A5M6IXL6_9PROT|nr:rod shape-determining protein RodA [Rhodovastum atsumiense]KAA5613073.1 rod shape-determining protein RodA [Rhodovastum atsumiense]CAH2600065.1 SEDS family protein MrdB [Rhodovastum atsumiense]
MSVFERRLIRETSFGLTGKLWRIPWLYVLLLCTLAGVGYVALYSAAGGSSEPYAAKHILRFAFGLGLMLSIALVDIRFIARLSWLAYAGGVLLLVLVLHMGHVGKGAQRWIEIGGMQWQPSELMKIALVMALASWFHKASWERMGNPLFLIPPAIALAVPVVLILKEPNLGTAVITAVVGGTVFLGAGLRWWKVGLGVAGVAAAAPIAYNHLHDYQRARITTFLNPENDPLGAGYNIIQSKIALGSGGMWGKGYLQGTQGHLNFLPEKQTDFIFTMIAEEFGLVGGVAVLVLLGLIILGGMAMALRCRHQYGRLVALGISMNFFMYVFVNIAMVMGAIPVGGVPLPLVSHGGSAMITVMAGFGLLLSVHVHRDVEFGEGRDEV